MSSFFPFFLPSLAGPVHDEEIDLAGILISVVSIFIAWQGRGYTEGG